ncbi:DUF1501 domain-containing protein [Zavarzinella formosa]|uniref:DUF1501 domain-containing protein n=1 Tax=Zavarzinella formosa TaxID=360055 RepID=UPI00030BF024|nr:DUF1501 domain-containing protein [Zavarzinella formosa]
MRSLTEHLASRRECLHVGGLSALGLSLPTLLGANARASGPAASAKLSSDLGSSFGKAKNVIYLWLQGGPPQHETFDPKPDAPVDIRGPFKPINTNVPGIRFCELLPRTARHADKLAVIRSLSTRDDNHDVSGYWLMTGYPYGPGSARQIKPTDWPYFGSVVKMLKPSEKLPSLTTVWIPDAMRLNDNVTPAGQTAGFLGKLWEPERFVGDPNLPDYHIQGLDLSGELNKVRVDHRRELLGRLDRGFDKAGRSENVEAWDRLSHHAFDLVTSGKARAAFDLSRETDKIRERYGRHTWGQSVLLARRLIEAGVRLVHVNWARDPGDSAVDNPLWDTHAQNAERLQDSLCPQFDVSFAALLEDLADRGLLEETLIVAVGEFGRTPRINKQGGRDHWGHVFSMALAGAGIRGGQVIGASDKNGAYPATDPIRGGDVTATIFHLLGIDHGGMFIDKTNRPHPITKGEPITAALGNSPATAERCEPGGDLAFVPPYDANFLLDTAFDPKMPLVPPAPPSRDKGWRAAPLWDKSVGDGLAIRKESAGVAMGFGLGEKIPGAIIAAGSRCVLGQEIRNARGGQYTFTIQATGEAASAEEFEKVFLANFTCRLAIFRYRDMNKDPRGVDEVAAAEFRPIFGKTGSFKVDRFLGSSAPGANFPIGNGLGVAVIIEKKTPGPMTLPPQRVALKIQSVTLVFSPAPRDENNDV